MDFSSLGLLLSSGGAAITAVATVTHHLHITRARKDREMMRDALYEATWRKPERDPDPVCAAASPDNRWKCPLEPGHVGVHENYHAAWYGGMWFPVLRESDWAAVFDATPGVMWELK